MSEDEKKLELESEEGDTELKNRSLCIFRSGTGLVTLMLCLLLVVLTKPVKDWVLWVL